MLLGALVDAGVPLAVLQDAVAALPVEPVLLRAEDVVRAGLGATRVHVDCPPTDVPRTWADVRRAAAPARTARSRCSPGSPRRRPRSTGSRPTTSTSTRSAPWTRWPTSSASCAGLAHLGLTRLSASPLSLGSGTTRGAHGPLPVPAPAVLALLRGVPVQAGRAAHEATTPTGAALLATLVDAWEPLPPMVLDRVGVGAGGRDLPDVANVLRLVLGEPGRDVAWRRRRARDERRRPGPPAVARRAGAAARRRGERRVADAGAHEEGPAGAHAVGALPAPRRPPPPARWCSARRRRSALREVTGRQARARPARDDGRRRRAAGPGQAGAARRPRRQRDARVGRRRRGRGAPWTGRPSRCCRTRTPPPPPSLSTPRPRPRRGRGPVRTGGGRCCGRAVLLPAGLDRGLGLGDLAGLAAGRVPPSG